jgi:hypothetical protein
LDRSDEQHQELTMVAVLQYDPYTDPTASRRTARPCHPVGPHRQPGPRLARRPAPGVFRRRRVTAALAGLVLALTVARAGAALEGHPLATPERLPHVQTVVVQPGDSLWSIARHIAPDRDPREVVDALVQARHTSSVIPGETITWQDS